MSMAYYGRPPPPEESIYNLIPREEIKPSKPARFVEGKPGIIKNAGYTSKFKGTVKTELKKDKAPAKTMGPAKVDVSPPKQFLKKHQKEPKLPPKQEFHYPDEDSRRPAVPRKEEKPLMGLQTNKNFITTNAVENIMSVPKKPVAKYVDTPKGATFNLDPSGLNPKYVQKKDYGKTPEYLNRRKEEVQRAQEEYEAYVREHFRRGAMKSLSEAERQMMLDGLKDNWELLHHQYQGLSVVTDTAPKKARKERMEAEMKQLERDIEAIQKHKTIYVANH
ncbi:ENKUR [Branchiostoma lanceolatum]|uniref:ENKUR protein n=1 Tax=Branchiostoma lanceolatum TaxID=7740 RepID=A0A8J9VCU2_BRALA|nr:ENKUR [Branchiostoma lanceolatum]